VSHSASMHVVKIGIADHCLDELSGTVSTFCDRAILGSLPEVAVRDVSAD